MTTKQTSLNPDFLAAHYGITETPNIYEEQAPRAQRPERHRIPEPEHSLIAKGRVALAVGAAALSLWGVNELAHLRGDQEKAPWNHHIQPAQSPKH